MKTQTNFLPVIGQLQLSRLTVEVKETLAALPMMEKNKTFSHADMWNIQRRKRSFTQRRFIF